MENLTKFILEYEKYKKEFPVLYFSIKQTRKNDIWRVEVFACNLADRGDALLVSSESKDKDEAIEKALAKMGTIPAKIENLTSFKTSGHRLLKAAAI